MFDFLKGLSAETLLAIYNTIVLPVVAGIGAWFGSWRAGRRKEQVTLRFLRGLPPPMKAMLAEFVVDSTHTLTGSVFDAGLAQLVRMGVLAQGESTQPFNNETRFFTLRASVWTLLPKLQRVDADFAAAVAGFQAKPNTQPSRAEHQQGRSD